MVDTARSEVALLHRRFGFGATAEELDAAAALGYPAAVARLLTFTGVDGADATPPPALSADVDPPTDAAARQALRQQRNGETRQLVDWWMGRMVATTVPAREKLTWFWHGHFATSVAKVNVPALMLTQNQLFRSAGAGPFRDLVQAVAKDPAMLLWLDSNSNVKAHPNENFARELMELFALGLGHYTEDDVKQAARCFTGWSWNRQDQAFRLRPNQHDTGPKTVLGHTGDLSGEDVIDLITSSDASARFVASRLWSHYAYPIGADDPIAAALAAARPATVADLLTATALHPAFRSDATRTGLIKQPVEWLVGALRALKLPWDPAYALILTRLGQVPFTPPNVAGWPQNLYWVSTASALARLTAANQLARAADLSALGAVKPADRVAACARLLGVDQWSDGTTAALAAAAGDPRALVALALVSPEHVLN